MDYCDKTNLLIFKVQRNSFIKNSKHLDRSSGNLTTAIAYHRPRWFCTAAKIREDINEKKTFSFEHCPNHLTHTPWPHFGQLGPFFFGSQNSRFESQFRTKTTIYTIQYTVYIYMQPKKQLKVQYIGIFEEIDSFYWPKMHF